MSEDYEIRKAVVADVPAVAELINHHAQKGIMLQRPMSRIYDNIRDYLVVYEGDELAACGALHVTWADLAEIRAMAVRDSSMRRGYGRMLVERLIEEARGLGVARVFVLTYQEEFFTKVGFTEIDKSELPHKIWNECINCIHFPNCNEIAMIMHLDG